MIMTFKFLHQLLGCNELQRFIVGTTPILQTLKIICVKGTQG